MDRLEVRTLCSSEDTALRPELIDALQADASVLLNDRCLHGFVTRYFAEWRTMAQPETVEALLRSVFARYTGKNPAVQGWAKALSLFSERASDVLAEEICAKRSKVNDVLKANYIELVTGLANATRDATAALACQQFRKEEKRHDEEWQLQYLRWFTEQVLPDVSQKSLCAAASWLILSGSARQSVTFQQSLRDYIQLNSRLGDPRMRETSLNWRAIDPEAAQLYLSWLARDSIIFFFNTLLPNNSENRRRKDFWLRYHDKIHDFQVAVSEQDIWKLKARKNSEMLCYSQVDHATASAFLMKFKGYNGYYLVAEFSETGNAAYIFKMQEFESRRVTLRTPRFDLKNHLKFDKTHRIIHNGDWESAASRMLYSEFGIQP